MYEEADHGYFADLFRRSELQHACRRLGLPSSGSKRTLAARLLSQAPTLEKQDARRIGVCVGSFDGRFRPLGIRSDMERAQAEEVFAESIIDGRIHRLFSKISLFLRIADFLESTCSLKQLEEECRSRRYTGTIGAAEMADCLAGVPKTVGDDHRTKREYREVLSLIPGDLLIEAAVNAELDAVARPFQLEDVIEAILEARMWGTVDVEPDRRP